MKKNRTKNFYNNIRNNSKYDAQENNWEQYEENKRIINNNSEEFKAIMVALSKND